MKTAILVDGGFYRKRAKHLFGQKSARDRAYELCLYCQKHLTDKASLYRIFYYDCPPLSKKVYNPIYKQDVDFKDSELFLWMTSFLDELRTKRKVALRLGRLSENQIAYTLKPESVKQLFLGTKELGALNNDDLELSMTQKGVDMKIGIDIASMAYKKQVEQIVLISGDSDFVPAAKLARREGIDFILDSMGAHISADLSEHIDGLQSHIYDFRQ